MQYLASLGHGNLERLSCSEATVKCCAESNGRIIRYGVLHGDDRRNSSSDQIQRKFGCISGVEEHKAQALGVKEVGGKLLAGHGKR